MSFVGLLAALIEAKTASERFQTAHTPRFELIEHVVGMAVRRGHHEMHVLSAAIHGVKVPMANAAMVRDGFLERCPVTPHPA
jgi:hypothetical protein